MQGYVVADARRIIAWPAGSSLTAGVEGEAQLDCLEHDRYADLCRAA
jgi:hypothetical protein